MNRTIVLLPGLGADRRLFHVLERAIPNLLIPPWPDPRPQDSLPTFAARLSDAIPKDDAVYLGGSSFGGMVALELAALLRPQGVFLIGSCTSPCSVTPLARSMRLVAAALPVSWFHPRRWSLPFVLPKFGHLTSEQKELFCSMASRTPASFLKWGIEAILTWRPTPVTVPIHHIHGSLDRLIPLRLVRPDRVVPGGGHLLPLTHPGEVTTFLVETITSRAAPEHCS